MAIELRKTGYCKDCPLFEPETFSAEITNDNGYSVLETNVTCKHEEACKRMDSMLIKIKADLLKKTYTNFETRDPNRFVVEHMVKESFESVELDETF